MNRWKSFDFGTETSSNSDSKSPVKKFKRYNSGSHEISHKTTHNSILPIEERNNGISYDFNKIVAPKNVSDLAVHTKKVQEVDEWLKRFVLNKSQLKSAFLLVSGPTGSGKATTLRVLCKSLNISIREWANPVDIDYELIRGQNQIEKFTEFVLESKYDSLFCNGASGKKITLIKDFPNALIRNPKEFLNILDDCFHSTNQALVFICTDASSKDINLLRTLFPDDVQAKYDVVHCSFNACAPTLLRNALKRAQKILQETKNNAQFRVPTESNVEAIIASCMGDIRSAVNQFYLSSLRGSDDLPIVTIKSEKSNGKRKRNEKSDTKLANSMRDESLGLFHALGRVLNPKPNCNVQHIVDEFQTQPNLFISLLCENYMKYFGELSDISDAADVLSNSEQFLTQWDNADSLQMGLWMSVLGLMVYNKHKVSKWNQIRGVKKADEVALGNLKSEGVHPIDKFYYHLIKRK